MRRRVEGATRSHGTTPRRRAPRAVLWGGTLVLVVAAFVVPTALSSGGPSARAASGDAGATTTAVRASTSKPPLPGSWKRIFLSSFSGKTLNTTTWSTCFPWAPDPAAGCANYSDGEIGWYLPSEVKVQGGVLNLEASEQATAGQSESGQPETFPWRSGMVDTFSSHEFKYGYVQVVAKIPAGAGLWSALYLLPRSEKWPPEIDILETHGEVPSIAQLTLHAVGLPQDHVLYNTHENLASKYHTYAVNWEPHSVTWYLDGKKVFQDSKGVPAQQMYFLAGMEIDGLPGMAPNAKTPRTADFRIKSVTIWQKASSGGSGLSVGSP